MYLHKEFRAAELGDDATENDNFQRGNVRKQEFRAAEIRFYLHKEFRAAEIVGGRLCRKLLFSKRKIGERLRIFGFFNRAMLMII